MGGPGDSRGSDGGDAGNDTARGVQQLHEELERVYVGAAAAGQRLTETAERLGLGPELVEGTGDLVYGLVVQQLLLGARVARQGQDIGERLLGAVLDAGARARPRLVTIRVRATEKAREHVEVVNRSPLRGELEAVVRRVSRSGASEPIASGVAARFGRASLEPGRATSMQIEVDPGALAIDDADPAAAWIGTIEVSVCAAEASRVIESFDLEIWITP